ncbi:hypothetical protein DR66_4254 [Delftia acidovorans]|uniref:hypothetical protein n=1 Tax=Delftia acidovorans TaxID=80866 RepID=UPI0005052773|nr:hypothetical protein [Delftia acidovorans]KFJ13174.1 hypothetical protein DR66_4254 [Delftia acidovorans]QQB47824.1 hypothetical protein I6H54_15570 [Delftia acidovorans]
MSNDKFLSDTEKEFLHRQIDIILDKLRGLPGDFHENVNYGLNLKKSLSKDHERNSSDARGILEKELVHNTMNFCSGIERLFSKSNKLNADIEKSGLFESAKQLREFCESFLGAINFPIVADGKIRNLLSRIDELESKAAGWRAKYEEYSNNADKSLDALMKRLEKNASNKNDEALEKIEQYRAGVLASSEHLNALISEMASSGLTMEYMKNATIEKKAADFYRRVSLITMCGIGFFSVLLFVILEFDLRTTQHVLVRLAVAAFFTFIAAYTAKQSALHRSQEHSYLRKAMDLNAITPYLAAMPEESKNTIKGQLAQKLFTPADTQHGCDSASFGLIEVVTKLTEKIPTPKSPG